MKKLSKWFFVTAIAAMFLGCGSSSSEPSSDGTLRDGTYKSQVIAESMAINSLDITDLLAPAPLRASGLKPSARVLSSVAVADDIVLPDSIYMYIEVKIAGSKMNMSMYTKMPPFMPDFSKNLEMRGDWEVVGDTTLLVSHSETREIDFLTGEWTPWELDEEDFLLPIKDISNTSFSIFVQEEFGWLTFTRK